MTFGSNIKQLLDYVYGDIEVTKEEIDALETALDVEGNSEARDGVHSEARDEVYNGLVHMKAINNLFKNVTRNLLKELDALEREKGGKLRKQQPTGLKLPDNVRMDSDDTAALYKENFMIGINNIKMKKLIDRMKEVA